MTKATIDLEQKVNIRGVADRKHNYFAKDKQGFYKSPSGKMISLAEQLPNGDWWIAKTWRFNSLWNTF